MVKQTKKITYTKSSFPEKYQQIWQILSQTDQVKKKNTITNSRNDSGNITTNFKVIKETIREDCEKMFANKLSNLDDIDKCLER